MYDDYNALGFTALAINLWEDWSIVRYYARQYSYPFYRDNGTAWNLYRINGYIPLNYVVDPEGIVRYGAEGFNETAIRSIIESYLPGISEHRMDKNILKNLCLFPNPATKTNILKFSLSKSSKTDIRIYSSSGKLVRKLYNGTLPAGSNSFNWNLRDDAFDLVGNGIYHYEIVTETGIARTKVLVIK